MLHINRLQEEIEALSQVAARRHKERDTQVERALRWLDEAPQPDDLQEHLARIRQRVPDWSGAYPATAAPLGERTAAPPTTPPGTTLIAVDGSQIFPDRHGAIPYFLIQVGALIFRYDGKAPEPHRHPTLYFREEDLYDDDGYLVTAARVGTLRAVEEMAYLAEMASAEGRERTRPAFAVTDGPLLWPYTGRGDVELRAFYDYLDAMRGVQEAGSIPVGYVDRPGGHALLALLWATRLAPEEIPDRLGESPLQTLTDVALMEAYLGPGERTPWFYRATSTQEVHRGRGQEIWFCYLNVGARSPVIARLEMPVWAAQNDEQVAILHAAMLHQAEILRGYPYALGRAHEIALVTTQDKAVLEGILQRRLLEQGILLSPSEKARQKSYLGRRR